MMATSKYILALILGCFILLSVNQSAYAKKNPSSDKKSSDNIENNIIPLPPLKDVTVIQNLSFGKFSSPGSGGGTVSVTSTGTRNATGTIFLFSSDNGNPGIFQVHTTGNGDIVTITTGIIVNLTNGTGGRMTLRINSFYPTSPFKVPKGNHNTNIEVGGTLTVAAHTSSGSYQGSFELTFNQQ